MKLKITIFSFAIWGASLAQGVVFAESGANSVSAVGVSPAELVTALTSPDSRVEIDGKTYKMARGHPELGPVIPNNAILPKNITIHSEKRDESGNLIVKYRSDKIHTAKLMPQ